MKPKGRSMMTTQPKNTQTFIIGVLSALVVVLAGWVGYDKFFKPELEAKVPAQIVEKTAVSEPVNEVSEPEVVVEPETKNEPVKAQHVSSQLNGNILQGSGTGEIYPELGFPDFTAPGYKKFNNAQLLAQIDAEYHEGLDMTDDPTAYGLQRIDQAPATVKKMSAFIQANLPTFANEVFARPNVSDVVVAMEGWMDLDSDGYLYRAVVTSARYQCSWYQVVIDKKTGKEIYEEFIPCYQPNQKEI